MRAYLLLLVPIFLMYSGNAQPVIPGLVANWKMDGNFNDISGNGSNGVNFGATVTTNKAGLANSAMNFNNPTASPASQFATFPASLPLRFSATDFSVSLMVNMSNTSRNMMFVDNNLNYGGYGVFIIAGSVTTASVVFIYRNGAAQTVSTTPMTGWKHLLCVRKSGVLSIYINGSLIVSNSEGTNPATYSFPGYFGAAYFTSVSSNNTYNGMIGKLDEVSIYNRALTNAEITSLASFLLPLKLGDFNAVKKSGSTALYWNTISETNTKNFVVERSNDGTTFNAIGEVTAAGNSSQSRNYEFMDATSSTGTLYYRLRMNDLDGTATISRVVAVTNNRFAGQLKVFPNPAVDQVQFQWQGQEGKQVQVEIMDLAGRIRFSRNYQLHDGVQTFSLPLAGFSSGLYTLRVKDATGQQSTIFSKN